TSGPEDEPATQMPAGPAARSVGRPPTANRVTVPSASIRATAELSGSDTHTVPSCPIVTAPAPLPTRIVCSVASPGLALFTSLVAAPCPPPLVLNTTTPAATAATSNPATATHNPLRPRRRVGPGGRSAVTASS